MTREIQLKIAGFHEMYGGIPSGNIILLIGDPGSGNDIFALQTLYLHALEGEEVIYLTTDRHPRDIIEEMKAYGWDIKKVESLWKFIDAYTITDKKTEDFIQIIIEEIDKNKWTCIDTITTIWMKTNKQTITETLREMRKKARKKGGLHFLIAIKGILDRKDEQILKHMADGILEFEPQASSNRGTIKITKMRRRIGTWMNIPYRITLRGIEIETAIRIL